MINVQNNVESSPLFYFFAIIALLEEIHLTMNDRDYFKFGMLASAILHSAALGYWGASNYMPPGVSVQYAPRSIELVVLDPAPMMEVDGPAAHPIAVYPITEIPALRKEVAFDKPKTMTGVNQVYEEPSQGAVTVLNSDVLKSPAPVYPALARQRGWEGAVQIKVFIDRDGLPSGVSIERSSGHTILDNAALDAVKKWQFKAARKGMTTLSSWIIVPIQFDLQGE